jgi:hypothetical protein
MTTFSYPPEGKLWHVKGNLEFKNSTDSPLFQGLGTIVVDGNVTFDNNAVCSKGSEVGIIASGSITFNGQGGVNSAINCGAYVALNGNITLPTALSSYQSWTGIFVAGGNINLPDAVSKNAQVNINYDANLAANPPILFRSVLNILSGSPS